MRILPILFNTEMTRAILEGRKGCTRRICKDANEYTVPDMDFFDADKRTYAVHNFADQEHTEQLSIAERTCPICPGDILYVRETWQCWRAHRYEATADIRFRAGGDDVRLQFANGSTDSIDRYDFDTFVHKWFSHNGEWKPSLFMPKEAARIWLRVTNVRVERLQEITENGAKAEGISEEWARSWWKPICNDPDSGGYPKYRDTFAYEVWDSTTKKSDLDRYGWDANPFVWVVSFERCEKPEVN